MTRKIPVAELVSIHSRFRELATAEPAAAALVDGASGRVTTRSQLLAMSSTIARELREKGVAPGDRLAVQLPNSAAFVAMFLAALELKLTFLPIDRDARESEIASILAHFSVRALAYCDEPKAADIIPTLSVREIGAVPMPSVPLIKLTSGSTGRPKGIVTSEGNLVADCSNICRTMRISAADRNLGAIPFSHSYGFSNLVMPLLLQGSEVVISNDYLPLSIIDLANRHRCTVVPGIPLMYDHLSQLPRSDGGFETVRTFISAGAPLSAAVSRRFRERFGIAIHTFYGCSECGGISYDRDGGAAERGTVGEPLEGVRVSLSGRSSRLLVTSDAVAFGCVDGDSRRAFCGRFEADDMARILPRGEIEIVGRVGDLINTASRKVNPREVERVILQIEGVREAKVYGENAGARGEVVAAAVVASPDITRERIRDWCRLHLSSHKVPRIVKLLESIPVDERGKTRRAALAELGEKR